MNPSANFPIVDRKNYVNAEKTIHYIQIKHVIEKTETEERRSQRKFE